MKKVYCVLGTAFAVMSLVACSQAEIENLAENQAKGDKVVFTASFEQPDADSKTYMGGVNNHQIFWNSGDTVKVWDDKSKSATIIAENDSAISSVFIGETADEGFLPEKSKYAFYPAGAVTGYNSGVITFRIPAEQTYAPNSFGRNANYAVSKIIPEPEENIMNLPFTNVAGVLRIQLSCSSETQLVKVSKIVFKDNKNDICGTFTVDAKQDKPVAIYEADGGKKITLVCPEPVALSTNESKPTSFYITLPVGAIEQNSGFVAEVYNEYDHLVTVLKTSNNSGNAAIMRSHITKMSNKVLTWLPKDVTEGAYLQSAGTGVISTGVNPSSCGGIRIQMKASINSTDGSNPSICGVINPADTKNWSPWISIDFHTNIQYYTIRACFSNSNLYPTDKINAGDIFECDATFVPNKFTATFNGGSSYYGVNEPTNTLPNGDLSLFASTTITNPHSENYSSSSIYSFVVYSADGTMIRNFIPVRNSSGTIGMYNMVKGESYGFYGPSAGTISLGY